MKKVLLLLLLVSAGWSLQPFTYYWTINVQGDTATVKKWKANNDSVLNFADRVCDTINYGLVHYSDFKTHTTTFPWMNVDTIPSADTINSKNGKFIKIDSLQWLLTDSLKSRVIYGNVYDKSISTGNFVVGYPNFNTYIKDTVFWKKSFYPDTEVQLTFKGFEATSADTLIKSDTLLPKFLRPTVAYMGALHDASFGFTSKVFSVDVMDSGFDQAGLLRLDTSGLIMFGSHRSKNLYNNFLSGPNAKGYYPFTIRYKQ
jgi:hypothetical protein